MEPGASIRTISAVAAPDGGRGTGGEGKGKGACARLRWRGASASGAVAVDKFDKGKGARCAGAAPWLWS
eukprot:scaffold16756_cov101-Isochrysis_galbana.AAC.2